MGLEGQLLSDMDRFDIGCETAAAVEERWKKEELSRLMDQSIE